MSVCVKNALKGSIGSIIIISPIKIMLSLSMNTEFRVVHLVMQSICAR